MKKEALSHFNNPDLVLFGFMLFFFTFIAVLFWVYRKSSGVEYAKLAQLPLLDEDNTRGEYE